ncbi:Jacalin-like lectin domain [Phytophthora cactorum]|nr:Jacalin-like lectin domain [Phytophthora cactorum]
MILRALLLVLVVAVSGTFSQDVQLSESFGGPHGAEFSDEASVVVGQTVGSITIRAGERVDGISLEVTGPKAATFSHGGTGGSGNTLTLAAGERITSMEAHWGKKSGRTRIFYLSFGTSAGNSVSGGSMTEDKNSVTAPEGFQLGGFFGRDGDEIDSLGAIWARIEAPPPATEPPAPLQKHLLHLKKNLLRSGAPPAESTAASGASAEGSAAATSVETTEVASAAGSEAPPPPGTEAPASPAAPSISVEDSVQLSESFGGPHGTEFSDEAAATSGQTVASITIRAGERVDGVALEIAKPKAETFSHGGTGGDPKTLKLGEGEYITSMEAHWGKKSGRTRIFYLSFGTSAGNSVSAGTQTEDKNSVTAPKGFQLGGFFGRDGDEIDTLGAIWTSIELVTPAPTEAPAPAPAEEKPGPAKPADSPGSGGGTTTKRASILSESFGGPHGNQFSDQPLAKSAQTISAVIIRAGERVDGVTLEVTAPTAETFTHGGPGGTENKLALEAGEHITSMEAHWGKKNGRTRIFYLNFGTSAGNSVSGGTKTDLKGSITAPEGYQLGGFFGRDGDEIDLLGVVWTSIEAVAESASTSGGASTDEDIVLSPVHGGPHGVAFSDVRSIVLGQMLSSSLFEVATPAEQTWTHGGKGGKETTLALGPGEYINSVEFHWGKKDGRTRVFYVNFGTSAGNSLSAGTKTEETATETAPEGFQLSGLHGRAENEVDQLGCIWTRIDAKPALLTDVVDTAWFGDIIRNWVGPTIGVAKDSACYRKYKPFDSKKMCPLGYGNDDDDCIAQCPMAYPVRMTTVRWRSLQDIGSRCCGVQCCNSWYLHKCQDSVQGSKVALHVCGERYQRYQATDLLLPVRSDDGAPRRHGKHAGCLLSVQRRACGLTYRDLCLSRHACPQKLVFAGYVVTIVENIVKQVIVNGDEIISSAKNVVDLLKNSSAANNSASTQQLTDRVLVTVNDLRNKTPDAAVNDVRVAVSKSSLVTNDIPSVTNDCMKELLKTKTKQAAFETRDLLRKTMEVIIDQLVETATTDMGKNVAENDQMLEIANFGLVVLGGLDPTGIVYMASQFVQPICGPTGFMGEIDDGNLYDALGCGRWTKLSKAVTARGRRKGMALSSTDKEDVTVVIHSGGDDYAEVDVGAGDTVTWESTVPELQDKTLYLDRWRPGLFGLPGSGGGSLLLWVPRAADGVVTVSTSACYLRASSVDDPIQLSKSFGGLHGTKFSDKPAVTTGQVVGPSQFMRVNASSTASR